jgi:hypothetical protein
MLFQNLFPDFRIRKIRRFSDILPLFRQTNLEMHGEREEYV